MKCPICGEEVRTLMHGYKAHELSWDAWLDAFNASRAKPRRAPFDFSHGRSPGGIPPN